MPPQIQLGQDALLKICEVFEIDQLPVKRLIIDIEPEGAVTIYTEQLIGEKNFGNFLNILIKEGKKPKTQFKRITIPETSLTRETEVELDEEGNTIDSELPGKNACLYCESNDTTHFKGTNHDFWACNKCKRAWNIN